MSAIIIEDKIVHFEVLGRGKPIIFLHGWVGSWRYWIPAMQSASSSYRAYAFDLWGFGETARYQHRYSLEMQVDLLAQFMKAMGISKTALVGHGLGALVAMLLASRQAALVDRAMLISTPSSGSDLLDKAGGLAPVDLANRYIPQAPSTDPAQAEAAKTDPAALSAALEDLSYLDLLEVSRQLTTATLVVHGIKDPLVDIPDFSLNGSMPVMMHQVVFNQAGHFPMLERPNKFNRLMKYFLDLPSGESPTRLQLKEEWKRRVR